MTAPSSSVKSAAECVVAVRNFEIDADVPGKRHFNHGRKQSAVGAIVVGQELLLAAELLDHVPEIFQVRRDCPRRAEPRPSAKPTCARIEPPSRFLPSSEIDREAGATRIVNLSEAAA